MPWAGARSLIIFASCHGTAIDGSSLRRRLTKVVDEAGIPVCGGNGMGLLNIEANLRLCGFYQPRDLRRGGISYPTHSGSLSSAMLHNRRGLRFNLVVSNRLETETKSLAHQLAMVEPVVMSLTKKAMNAAWEEAGFRAALRRGADLGGDIETLRSPERVEFERIAAERSLKEAIRWRDSRFEK